LVKCKIIPERSNILRTANNSKNQIIQILSVLPLDAISAFHDAKREKYNICPGIAMVVMAKLIPQFLPQDIWLLASKMLQELIDAGFNQKAVDVLQQGGLKARVNEVGHIAVAP
jgi:hypothetical protein